MAQSVNEKVVKVGRAKPLKSSQIRGVIGRTKGGFWALNSGLRNWGQLFGVQQRASSVGI
jgi:hypothetical protein